VVARHAGLACDHRLQVYFLAVHLTLRLVYLQRHAGRAQAVVHVRAWAQASEAP
jgi:hypothetical protein